MSVYLTKSMLSKLNKVKYPKCNSFKEDEDANNEDHWQKLSMDG